MYVFLTEDVATSEREERCRFLHFCRWTDESMLVCWFYYIAKCSAECLKWHINVQKCCRIINSDIMYLQQRIIHWLLTHPTGAVCIKSHVKI